MNRLKFCFVIFSLTIVNSTQAQKALEKLKIEVPPTVCYASDKIEKSFIPPPSFINLKSEKKAKIIVDYSLFPQNAKDAFQHAVEIWEGIIESDVPIYIQANWRTQNQNVLGSAGSSNYYANFKNTPHTNRFYPVAIAEKITKTEITGSSSPDIVATFNKEIDWYFGTDGKTPELLYDFVTVVLHEITHGLGFTGFFFYSNNLGAYSYSNDGDASAFDLLVVRNNGNQLVDTQIYDNYSTELGSALISRSLYANSPVAKRANNGNKPRLYAPSEYDDGSSIYHLNDGTYPSGNDNSLMTHAIGKGEAIHDPGPLTKGIINDIGWKHMYLDFNKPKDLETVQPISFNVEIESDYKLDSASVFVYYSYNNFENHNFSLPLLYSESKSAFTTTFTPEIESGEIQYYIIAKDTATRIFTLPTEAPKELHTITIGPDHEPPEIDYSPIPYFLLANENLTISTNADDNLGIDTVYVEFEINGVPQQSFGLTLDSQIIYSGSFDFDLNQLNDGDEITYSITAKDSAIARNTTTIPADDKFSFKIEKIFDPVGGYINNFNNSVSDFIFSDFDIYTETGFESSALQSLHPYPSPKIRNTEFNFYAILKQPIILFESGTMTFNEIVLVEPGESQSEFGDDNFWDYVIIEGSKDYGKSWLPLIKGYDSGDNNTWKNEYNENLVGDDSKTIGIPEWYINREIDMLENGNFTVNDTILIRFRLFSDPLANGWGWAIDNLRIQFPVSAPTTILSPGNIMVYPNPFNNVLNVSVQANKQVDKLEFEVFNMFGQKIVISQFKNVIGEISHKIDLQKYADGMYLISVKENSKQIFSRKIIKNNN